MVRAFCCLFIRGYQYFISPYLPVSCRFELSCSEYTRLAIIKYGIMRGIGYGMCRLLKCQPFYDNYNDNDKS